MNIFVLDQDPRVAAIHLVDRHISKMITESAQILSNCFTLERMSRDDCPKTQSGKSRKHSYPHHPCCIWATKSRENMKWVIEHAVAMDIERKSRFNKTDDHFSLSFITWAKDKIDESLAPEIGLTPFAQAMPDQYKHVNAVIAYRQYYKYGKIHLHKWTKNKPTWA